MQIQHDIVAQRRLLRALWRLTACVALALPFSGCSLKQATSPQKAGAPSENGQFGVLPKAHTPESADTETRDSPQVLEAAPERAKKNTHRRPEGASQRTLAPEPALSLPSEDKTQTQQDVVLETEGIISLDSSQRISGGKKPQTLPPRDIAVTHQKMDPNDTPEARHAAAREAARSKAKETRHKSAVQKLPAILKEDLDEATLEAALDGSAPDVKVAANGHLVHLKNQSPKENEKLKKERQRECMRAALLDTPVAYYCSCHINEFGMRDCEYKLTP